MTHLCFFFIIWALVAMAILIGILIAESVNKIGLIPTMVWTFILGLTVIGIGCFINDFII